MTISAALDEDLGPIAVPRTRTWARDRFSPPVVVAAAFFLGLCLLVLTRASQFLEPDDLAYRASIIALQHGHLWLTNAQYLALSHQLAGSSSGAMGGIAQWVHRADGTWISEKNPGYPFYAVGFAWLGILRLAPLFYGAFAAVSLYLGGRRWMGRWGGTAAVALFCSSGAAMVFAWRATMPTFTDASMVATGCGLLLWTVLATDHGDRHRIVAGLAAFFAFDSAMFIRYTDVVAVLCAVAVVALLALFARSPLPRRAAVVWLGSQALFVAFLLSIDTYLYGHPFSTGYASGEIAFSTGALPGNLGVMPRNLIVTMPVLVLAALGLGWVVARGVRARHTDDPGAARRDLWVGLALASVWVGVFVLYLLYNWTVHSGGPGDAAWGNVHLIRFYLPAIGPIALLGAWPLLHVPKVAAMAAVAALVVLGTISFGSIASAAAAGGPAGSGGLGCGPRAGIGAGPPGGAG
ncbi:MAG TPA: hypothetical protein VMU09_01080, partial [Acidimicrobiales bacterium]|nr:hypothetical protein [Acidimicrobiales bacterium]